ncbi:hypothetical protein EDC14_102055 [Hydrogenispora ethanolica]|uniref:Uncharacterized protein n=1 Tax=Hydrogenispora ethanolica TaxID=1082276 RepID=A0A4R1RDR2_HYDET|nr:hypothetical protein [Hydrogenispora ethanolica]TCL63770.1 hypothetical protein EDC14_102055 [Hydrogenispora ethanolica]
MERIQSRYGWMEGIVNAALYPEGGAIRECLLNRANPLETPYGILTPQYEDDGVRRKYAKSLSFWPNGNLRSISLQEQTPIVTPLGVLPAELVTFYESGALKRLFPLNGKLSGYWTEANEYGLAEELELALPSGRLRRKIIGLHFYESGAVHSVTLWPRDQVTLETPLGPAAVRLGFSFYENGRLRGLEPFLPWRVPTAIGWLMAYHPHAIGVHADAPSLTLDPAGKVQSLITAADRITVTAPDGRQAVHQPGRRSSLLHEGAQEIVPLAVRFTEGKVRFGEAPAAEYDLARHSFAVTSLPPAPELYAGGCPGCDADGG